MVKHGNSSVRKIIVPVAVTLLLMGVCPVRAQSITNLQQLTQTLFLQEKAYRDVRLEVTVCAASRPAIGVLIVQDDSGVELLEVGAGGQPIHAGDRIRIRSEHCLLRKRETGIEISAVPVVDNDGTHGRRMMTGEVALNAGPNPVRLDWFNSLGLLDLEASYSLTNGLPQSMDASNLCHAVVDESGRTNFLPGLHAECYEGNWEIVPDFNLLQPKKSGIATNFDLGFRTRDEMVGIRYTGYFNAPCTGRYTFSVSSDDGSLLFLPQPELPVARIGATLVPEATRGFCGEGMNGLTERRWVTVRGRASFVSKIGAGLEFELRSDLDVISVWLADAAGLDPSHLLNAQVKVTGAGRAVVTADQRIVLGRLCAASSHEVLVETAIDGQSALPITSVGQVQSLPIEAARRGLPVRIRGVVTNAKHSTNERRMSIQDDTRGIYVDLSSITNARPEFGEFWEVAGHSGAGNFAPIIIADKIAFLGDGRPPTPVRPTWTELLNGSMDVQWVELQGLVTGVRSNNLSLLLPAGQVDVLMDAYHESELKSFEKCIVRIRGVLYALWNAENREVRVGGVMMRNALISVDAPAPRDPFKAVLKTPRELLLFDPQATAFRRVKVRGQIIYADETRLFLEEDGMGLLLQPSAATDLRVGDLVEAAGYPDISKAAMVLRDANLRKTGEAPLPDPQKLAESELTRADLNSTRVRIQGQLLGWHFEQGAPVLEMQSGTHLFLARLAHAGPFSLRVGSELALAGVYVSRALNQPPNAGADAFELLMNAPADIRILSEPSLWTLQRLLVLLGILLLGLMFTAIWITQLRRLVGQRTTQLQREIREREHVERQHAIEAERARIARDLHDDLGSSLTEISVLASTGQRPGLGETSHPNLFQAIASKARKLIAALDVIVWAVDPEDNSLQSLADYLCGYAEEFFSNTNLACRFKVPATFPPVTLEGRLRHDLHLAVKEALNNLVRHADATEAEFRLVFSEGNLEIEIADNGKGLPGELENAGHGLKNLPARLKNIGGDCTIESGPAGGTTVRIRLPLAASVKANAGN